MRIMKKLEHGLNGFQGAHVYRVCALSLYTIGRAGLALLAQGGIMLHMAGGGSCG